MTMTTEQRIWTGIALDFRVVWVRGLIDADTRLLPVEREPHKARPRCAARQQRPSDFAKFKRFPEYGWCDEPAHWLWGEQDLCQEHAAQLALGIHVTGITADGRWR